MMRDKMLGRKLSDSLGVSSYGGEIRIWHEAKAIHNRTVAGGKCGGGRGIRNATDPCVKRLGNFQRDGSRLNQRKFPVGMFLGNLRDTAYEASPIGA